MDVSGTATGAFGLFVPTSGTEITLYEFSSPEIPGGAVFETPVAITVDNFDAPPEFVRQEFDADLVNSNAELSAAVVRLGDSLWAAHAILGDSGTTSAVRWYEIDLIAKTVKQSGTIQSDTVNYIYPSIAITPAGHIVIGHTSTGVDEFPTASVSVGYNNNGAIAMEDPVAVKEGEGGYFDTRGNLWGRYQATVADTEDPTKVWVFGQWSDNTDDGQTQVSEITLLGYSPMIDGTTGDDTFIVRRSATDPDLLEVDINGAVMEYEEAIMYSITVDGMGGTDTFILDTVNGEFELPMGVNFIGDGDDHLQIDSSLDAQWVIDGDGSGSLTLNALSLNDLSLTFVGIEEIDGSQGIDTFDIQMTNTDLTIRTRGGEDMIVVNNTGTGLVSASGNLGNDSFEVLNSGGGVALDGTEGMDTFTVDDAGTGMSTLMGGTDADTFHVMNSGTAGLTIFGNEGMDVFNFDNLLGTATTVAHGGDDNDQFNVIDAGLGDLELRGEGGDDEYFVTVVNPLTNFSIVDSVGAENDSLTAVGTGLDDVFDIADGSVMVNGGLWTITGIESFNYDGLGGNDTFNVDLPMSWDGMMTLMGGDDDDQFFVTNSGQGPITLLGQGGNDDYEVTFNSKTDVTINDDGVVGDDQFKGLATVNSDELVLAMDSANINGGMLSITGVESVEYDALAGKDVFTVNSAIGQSLFVGNDGRDSFNVYATADFNHFRGDAGEDSFFIFGSDGMATFEGGIDDDTFHVMMTTGNGTFDGQAGNDVFDIESVTGDSNFWGGDGEDVFTITNRLPLGSVGSINIDGGAARNLMVVNGYQSMSNDAVVTDTMITGLSAVPIIYASTGGSFSIDGANGGITLFGSATEINKFEVASFRANNSLLMKGGSADDIITVRAAALGAIEADGLEGTDTYQYAVGSGVNRFLFALDTGLAGTDRLITTLTEGNDQVMLSGEVFMVDTDTMVFNDQFEALIIDSRGGDDQISVARMDVGFLRLLTRNGSDTVNVNEFAGIQRGVLIEAGDDNDNINLLTSAAESFVQAYGGAGSDTIFVSSNSYGNAIVDGQEGSDQTTVEIADRSNRFVVARDSGTAGFDELTVLGSVLNDFLIFRSGVVNTRTQSILYNEKTEVLNVESVGGDDILSVYGISAAQTNIFTGNGEDYFVQYSTFGNAPTKILDVDLGVDNDIVVVRGSNADTTTTISGKQGNEFFNIGSSRADNNGNLDLVQGLVTVNGDGGNDRLYINDRGKISSFDLRVDVASVREITSDSFPFFAGVDYDSIDVFRLDATDFKNLIEVVGSEETTYEFVGNGGFNQLLLLPDDDGRELVNTGTRNGFYTFDTKRDIFFTNFFIV